MSDIKIPLNTTNVLVEQYKGSQPSIFDSHHNEIQIEKKIPD